MVGRKLLGGEGGTPPKIPIVLLTDKLGRVGGPLYDSHSTTNTTLPGIGPVVCERKRLVVLVRIQALARRLVYDKSSAFGSGQ